jgi:hypothetical protein
LDADERADPDALYPQRGGIRRREPRRIIVSTTSTRDHETRLLASSMVTNVTRVDAQPDTTRETSSDLRLIAARDRRR